MIPNRKGDVQHISQTAVKMLYYLQIPRMDTTLDNSKNLSIIAPLQEKLFCKFAESMNDSCGEPPAFLHENDWGRFVLRAYCLDPIGGGDGEGLIGVIIQNQEPLHFKLIRSLSETTLSQREREVALWMFLGHTYPEIAIKLSLSKRTVVTHSQNIFNKLGFANLKEITNALLLRP